MAQGFEGTYRCVAKGCDCVNETTLYWFLDERLNYAL